MTSDHGSSWVGNGLLVQSVTGVHSGGISGHPASLPGAWHLVRGYLVGPGADLAGADLSGADLSGFDLSGADLANANFTGADLTGADLTGAALNNATWHNTACPDGTNSDDDGGTCVNHL